jgi:catechol 2,3-dioxygenase-like lactoylglutathione lyase family enzyme
MHCLRSNTILYCRNWQPTVEFYRDRLGLEIHFQNDWLVEFQVAGDSFVSIADVAQATIASAAGQGITLSFQVDDAVRVHRELTAAGVSPTAIRRIWGAQAFYLFDPEGHRIEIWAK